MSAPSASSAAPRTAARREQARRRTAVRRRRVVAVLVTVGVAVALVMALARLLNHAVVEIGLPLRHEDIIRQQARDKGLDPALIAAVIYAESHFIDGRTSSAGAEGLMQLTPDTARYIARKSGGTAFRVSDLGTPQVNIAYGAYYLRYLLRHYAGNRVLALAAYNAGEGNVDGWVGRARARERSLTVADIPFGETRAYVRKVLAARTDYRRHYATELGLAP
jgi:soluble lytic murein transglycosylase